MSQIPLTPYKRFVAKWQNGCGSPLCQDAERIVLCKGILPCDVLFIGQAPGRSENIIGQPFVGPAGILLDRMINQSGLGRFRLAFCNLVCCLPLDEDGQEVPPPKEAIVQCSERLREFVKLSEPRHIICVGDLANKSVGPICCDRKKPVLFPEWLPGFIPMTPIIHPAAILKGNEADRGLRIQRTTVTLSAIAEEL